MNGEPILNYTDETKRLNPVKDTTPDKNVVEGYSPSKLWQRGVKTQKKKTDQLTRFFAKKGRGCRIKEKKTRGPKVSKKGKLLRVFKRVNTGRCVPWTWHVGIPDSTEGKKNSIVRHR